MLQNICQSHRAAECNHQLRILYAFNINQTFGHYRVANYATFLTSSPKNLPYLAIIVTEQVLMSLVRVVERDLYRGSSLQRDQLVNWWQEFLVLRGFSCFHSFSTSMEYE